MVAKKSLKSQLDNIGLRFRIFGRGEVKELQRVLGPYENIVQCAFGFFNGGSGLLVATNQRLLFIDKTAFYVNLEEFSYDAIDKVEINSQPLQASLTVFGLNKKVQFKSLSDARLRRISNYTKASIDRLARELMFGNYEEKQNSKIPVVYANSVWRPQNTIMLPRLRPTKFYARHNH